MSLTKTAEKYRGGARSKQETIDRLTAAPPPLPGGEWPAGPADALAS